jgi:hypothetical protein
MSPYDQVAAVLATTTPDGWWTPDEESDPQGVYGPDGDEVARVNGNLALGGEAADNARFIALARNTYPELLAVARAAEAVSEYEANHPDLVYVNLRAALSDLEAKFRG